MTLRFRWYQLVLFLSLGVLVACSDDDDNEPNNNGSTETLETPQTYKFTRNGQTTVSYSGQTDRLNQLAEIKAELGKGDKGNVISAQVLKDMFANTNGNGGGNFSFSSSKQLKNKTFDLDQSYFEALFDSAATASAKAGAVTASNGVSGIATRSGNKTILVDEKGKEFTQLIEKGLMGATFYNQIVNTYLTDSKIGDQVNNTDLVSGENYTEMEHHMDEAFGYIGAPEDFASDYIGINTPRYWGAYSNTADDNIQMNNRLMTPFKRARAAIAAGKMSIKDEEVAKIYAELEVLIAATAIHYANEAKAATVDADRLHVLSECYAFTKAFRYSNIDYRKLSQAEVETLLGYIGENFWETTETGLNQLIEKLALTYGLETVKNEL